MSSTTTQTQTQPNETQAPNITIIARVTSIPMISSGLGTIDDALSTNAYTRSSYVHAKAISNTAYKLTEPIQTVLAPLIIRADGFANMAVDAVESRYPYPFKAQPEEVAALARQGQENTTAYVHERVNTVNKAIDEKVRTPALNVAHDIDQVSLLVLSPSPRRTHFPNSVLLQLLITSKSPFPASIIPNQLLLPLLMPNTNISALLYSRRHLAITSMFTQTNNWNTSRLNLSSCRFLLFFSQNLNGWNSYYRQKASETAHSITAGASSSLASAQSRVTSLSDSMLVELDKLQKSATSLTASLQATLHNSASQIQSQIPQIQQSYTDLSAALSSTANELRSIIVNQELPLQEKVSRVGKEVRERIQPLLESVKKGVSEVLARSEPASTVNGNGHGGHWEFDKFSIHPQIPITRFHNVDSERYNRCQICYTFFFSRLWTSFVYVLRQRLCRTVMIALVGYSTPCKLQLNTTCACTYSGGFTGQASLVNNSAYIGTASKTNTYTVINLWPWRDDKKSFWAFSWKDASTHQKLHNLFFINLLEPPYKKW